MLNKIKLLKVNIINIVILALIVLFYYITGLLFTGHSIKTDDPTVKMHLLSNVMTVVLLLGWAGYTVYSNLSVIKESQDDEKRMIASVRPRLLRAGNKKFFVKERTHLVNMWDSMMSREKYFLSDERDERVRELYILTRNQMERYVTDSCEYLESFDYISGKDSGYLRGACAEAQNMLDKFNKMVELSVSVDDEVMSYDTREMDDMIEALEELKKSGKNKLAR